MQFTTAEPGTSPAVAAGGATGVTSTGATLNGTVNPNGQNTTYHFAYGTAAGQYTSSTADTVAGSGNSPQTVTATVSGLAPSTTYHFIVVATNASGTVNGPDQTFTTSAAPSSPNNPGPPQNGQPSTGPGPTKPATLQAPTCSLTSTGNAVLLKAPKKKAKAKGKTKATKPGTLTLKATCNQAASITLRGVLTETGKKPKHGKAKTSKFNLGPVFGSAKPGAPTTLTIQLPAAALSALKGGAKESIVFTLSATNANGKAQASATVGHLVGR